MAGRESEPSAFASLISFRRWSPRTSTSTAPPSGVTTGSDLISVAGSTPSSAETSSIVRASGVSTGSGASERAREVRPAGGRRRDLDVGRVARRPTARPRSRPPAQGAMYSCAPSPPIMPDVGLDPVPAQPAAVEDAVVGLDVQLVGGVEALLVAVEAVGVLHDELARAQHAGARPRLVPLLDLQVVEDLRQVAVRADVVGDVVGDGLLVGHREHQRPVGAVGEPEQLRDLGAAGPPPQLLAAEAPASASPGRRCGPSPL